MNKLSYGLLSLIAVTPSTGYDLTQRVQLFWNANHSQIYPLLALLEENGYTQFEHVPQSDKPDKKVYTITEAGKTALRHWISEPTSPPVIRDELALKLFSLWLVDQEAAKKLLNENIDRLSQKLGRLNKRLEELQLRRGPDSPLYSLASPLFGPQLLVEKSIAAQETELAWCHRVLVILDQAGAAPSGT